MEELSRAVEGTFSTAEVQEQVDAWKNRFIFRFTNDFYSVNRLLGHELNDRPPDRDQQVLTRIQDVSVEDVQRVARKYLTPDSVTISIFGSLTPEEAEDHPYRSVLTRAVGLDAAVEVDTEEAALEPGDRLLLCSDGLTSMISTKEIASILDIPIGTVMSRLFRARRSLRNRLRDHARQWGLVAEAA